MHNYLCSYMREQRNILARSHTEAFEKAKKAFEAPERFALYIQVRNKINKDAKAVL